MLNDIRRGVVTDAAERLLNTRWAATHSSFGDGIEATKLFSTRDDVDRCNAEHLSQLRGTSVVHAARDASRVPHPVRISSSNCRAKTTITLKEGAQVVLLKNLDQTAGLANGARGIVTGFKGPARNPVVRFSTGKEATIRPVEFLVKGAGGKVLASRTQLPLDLAWAVSMHACQGMTLERVEADLSNCFEVGQAYVALSRASSLGGLVLRSRFEPSCVKVHPAALKFYRDVFQQRGGGSEEDGDADAPPEADI